MVLPILALGAVSLVISWLLTAAMVRVAPRIGFVDKPGHRKIHSNPKPLGGGVAIFCAFALPMLAVVAAVDSGWIRTSSRETQAYAGGVGRRTPLALALVGATLVLHVMGLIDDRKALGPYVK